MWPLDHNISRENSTTVLSQESSKQLGACRSLPVNTVTYTSTPCPCFWNYFCLLCCLVSKLFHFYISWCCCIRYENITADSVIFAWNLQVSSAIVMCKAADSFIFAPVKLAIFISAVVIYYPYSLYYYWQLSSLLPLLLTAVLSVVIINNSCPICCYYY